MPTPVINAPQNYIVGSTVHCELRIAKRPNGSPYNPTTVTLSQIILLPSTTVTPIGVVTTHVGVGVWTFDIPTIGLIAGTYKVNFMCSDGPAATTFTSTIFVLTLS